MIFLSRNVLHVRRPFGVSGTFTATFLAREAKYSPSCNMVSKSVAVTSALTGPSTIEQIALIVLAISSPFFAISDGFVVTPFTNPVGISSSICFISAVSTKNFIDCCISYK